MYMELSRKHQKYPLKKQSRVVRMGLYNFQKEVYFVIKYGKIVEQREKNL